MTAANAHIMRNILVPICGILNVYRILSLSLSLRESDECNCNRVCACVDADATADRTVPVSSFVRN